MRSTEWRFQFELHKFVVTTDVELIVFIMFPCTCLTMVEHLNFGKIKCREKKSTLPVEVSEKQDYSQVGIRRVVFKSWKKERIYNSPNK